MSWITFPITDELILPLPWPLTTVSPDNIHFHRSYSKYYTASFRYHWLPTAIEYWRCINIVWMWAYHHLKVNLKETFSHVNNLPIGTRHPLQCVSPCYSQVGSRRRSLPSSGEYRWARRPCCSWGAGWGSARLTARPSGASFTLTEAFWNDIKEN